MRLKVLHISDTHGCHKGFGNIIDPSYDMIIHSGDCSNHRSPYENEPEVRNFLDWFSVLPVEHKIFVPGNHDTSIEKGLVTRRTIENMNIIYLENEDVTIKGIKIWGSPITPTFGSGWAWNRDRSKIHRAWDNIPDDTDIIVTHGPPKGILDLSHDRNGNLENCGCSNLRKRVDTIKPRYVMFGHIHNGKDYPNNAGIMQLQGSNTIFSNGACCTDGKWGELTSYGNTFMI